MTTLVEFQQRYAGADGLKNPGEIAGVSDMLAAALIAANIAVEVDKGAGLGVPTTSSFRGILASETPAQYAAAGGTLGGQAVSAAVQGLIGGAGVTVVKGRVVPNSEPWA